MNISIRSVIGGGFIIKDFVDGEMYKKTLKDVIDYINPQPEPVAGPQKFPDINQSWPKPQSETQKQVDAQKCLNTPQGGYSIPNRADMMDKIISGHRLSAEEMRAIDEARETRKDRFLGYSVSIDTNKAKRTADAVRLLLQDGIACRIYKHGVNWVIIPDGKASNDQANLQDDGK